MKKPTFLAVSLLLLLGCKKNLTVENTDNTTPRAVIGNPQYKTTIGTNNQEFTELKDAGQESERLQLGNYWTDFEATGFYLPANTSLQVTVTQLQGTSLPKLLIGTYSRDTIRWNPRVVQLTAGVNNITPDTYGGILWIRYTTTGTPAAKANITFNSGHQRMPLFIKNQTTQLQWNSELTTYATPDVLLVGDRAYQVCQRARAQSFQPQDLSYVLSIADKVWDWENYISGMDGSAPQHLPSVHNRILMTESNSADPGWYAVATYYRTAYKPGSMVDISTSRLATTAGWGAWHELGHMHQQKAWKWSNLGEVTVNIYSLMAERSLGIAPSRLKRDNVWPAAFTYLANTDPNKDFNASSPMTNATWVRLCMFHQLWLAFGDPFYIKVHKQARIDNPNVPTDNDKMRWFMLAACNASGRNLTTFFRKWGFRVPESVYTEIANLALSAPAVEPSTLNEDNSGLIENGANYKLVSALNNSSLLDVNSYTPVNGTLVSLWSNNNPTTQNQVWKLRSSGSGYFVLKTLADTTKVLDVTGSASANGTQIEVYTLNSSAAQQWQINYAGGGYYNLTPACAPGKNLDVNGGYTANGTKIQIWSAHSSNSQKFKFVKQ